MLRKYKCFGILIQYKQLDPTTQLQNCCTCITSVQDTYSILDFKTTYNFYYQENFTITDAADMPIVSLAELWDILHDKNSERFEKIEKLDAV